MMGPGRRANQRRREVTLITWKTVSTKKHLGKEKRFKVDTHRLQKKKGGIVDKNWGKREKKGL